MDIGRSSAAPIFGHGTTLAGRLAFTRNRPAGFDYMRVVLALGVIAWHSRLISYGINAGGGAYSAAINPFALLMVPMFFALSGFLVAGSLERSRSLFGFLGLRVFRIAPALVVEVLLSALILGPIFTTDTLAGYVADPDLHRYFLNMLGDIHFLLPGVFKDHPTVQVNGQLWTVPYELICYIVLSALAVAGVLRRPKLLFAFMAAAYAAQLANTLLRPSTEFQGAGGSSIVMAFVAGVLLYQYRARVPWSATLFAAMLVLSLAMPSLLPKGMRFAVVPIAYVTVYLGLMNPPRNAFILSGDYSYGLFLYGFPIQQAVYGFGPFFREWYTNLLAAVPLTITVAALSWWFIEKPVLGWRDTLKQAETWYLSRVRHQLFSSPSPSGRGQG